MDKKYKILIISLCMLLYFDQLHAEDITIHLRILEVQTQPQAEKELSSLKNGAPFKGNDIGEVKYESLNRKFKEAMGKLKKRRIYKNNINRLNM